MKKLMWTIALLALSSFMFAGDDNNEKGFMGINLMVQDGKDDSQAITVMGVHNGSGAELAGIQKYDKLINVNGIEITNRKMLSKALSNTKPGDEIDVTVERDGQNLDLRLVLGERPNPSLRLGNKLGKRWGMIIDENSAFLGVNMQGLNDQLANYFGVKSGILITEITEDSPAEIAGLQAGDIILAWEGEDIDNPAALRAKLRDAKPEDEVALTIQRKDERKRVPIVLGSRKGRFGDISLQKMLMDMDDIQIDIPTIQLEALKELENIELPKEALEKLKRSLKDLEYVPGDLDINIDPKIELKQKIEIKEKNGDKGQLH